MTAAALAQVLVALGMSLVGSFAPVFAAEAFVAVAAGTQSPPVAVLVAVAAAAGQTTGKVLVFRGVRAAGRLPWIGRIAALPRPAARLSPGPAPATVLVRASARADAWVLASMAGSGARAVLLLSSAVGLPPLLATTLYASRSAMRTTVFAVCCAAGRSARMIVIAVACSASWA